MRQSLMIAAIRFNGDWPQKLSLKRELLEMIEDARWKLLLTSVILGFLYFQVLRFLLKLLGFAGSFAINS